MYYFFYNICSSQECNHHKNWLKHAVTHTECEQLFFNDPLLLMEAISASEPRYLALGQTDQGRGLFIVFTLRNEMIRVISARDMSRKERNIYEKIDTEI
ncbi:MAG: BrnT family toxin [Gammaproteobacteria bacterium]